MKLSLVFPMFWGRKQKKIYKKNDQFYDHPTALDDQGTIPALFESMSILEDRDFDIIAVAGANHPSKEKAVERAAHKLLKKNARTGRRQAALLQLLAPGAAAPLSDRAGQARPAGDNLPGRLLAAEKFLPGGQHTFWGWISPFLSMMTVYSSGLTISSASKKEFIPISPGDRFWLTAAHT